MKTTALVLLLSCTTLHAREDGGRASARMDAAERRGHSITIPITVDASNVVIAGAPAVLGGYIARVSFDPDAVSYVKTTAGRDPFFSTSPTSTHAALANERGVLRIVGVQTNLNGPAGVIEVARVRFTERLAGGAKTIHVVLEQAAASPVPGRDVSLTIRVSQ